MIREDLNWNYLLQIANKHNLGSLLYFQLNQTCPDDVPDHIMVFLKDHFQKNAQKNLLMYGELLRLIKLLKNQQIPTIPYKGPILATREYGELSLREFNDLDLYIPYKHVLKAKEILLTQDYVPNIKLEPNREKKFIETQRDLKFFNKNLGIVLEIHWTFKSFYFSIPPNQKLCDKNNMVSIELGDVQISSPRPEDMFLILCWHNASHRWRKLHWLCDIQEFITYHDLDWQIVMDKARKLVIERVILINLHLVKELWGLEIPYGVVNKSDVVNVKKIVKKIEKNLFDDAYNELWDELMITFDLREKIAYGIKDVLMGIFVPGVCEWKTLKIPVILWPLYHVYRPFNLIRRYRK